MSSSDGLRCKISDGVMFLRHTAAASASASTAAPTPTPLLLFCAGFGTAAAVPSSSSSAASPASAPPSTSACRRVYWARMGSNELDPSSSEWSIECARLSELTHVRLGMHQPHPKSNDVDLQSRCFSLQFHPRSLPLCLEAASAAMRSCFLMQLKSLLTQEKLESRVQFHEALQSNAVTAAPSATTQPESDRPDALHFVLSHLHAAAMRNFNVHSSAKNGGSGAVVNPTGTVQLPHVEPPPKPTLQLPTIIPLPSSSSSSSAVAPSAAASNADAPAPPSATDPSASSAPLLLQLSVRSNDAFGLVSDAPAAAVLPYTGQTVASAAASAPRFLCNLALAAFERHPISGRLSYLDHSEVILLSMPLTDAGGGPSVSSAFDHVFNVLFHSGLKQQLLLSMYDVSLGNSEEDKAKQHAATGSTPHRPTELHVHERNRIGTSVLLLDEIMKSHPYTAAATAATTAAPITPPLCLHEMHTPLLNYNNPEIASHLQRKGSRYTISIRVCSGKQLPDTVKSRRIAANHTQNGSSSNAVAMANGAVSSSSAAPAPSVRSLPHSNPENLSVKQKLQYFEDVGNEQWYNPLTGVRSTIRSADFVPTKQYWEAMKVKAEEEEAKLAAEGACLYAPKGSGANDPIASLSTAPVDAVTSAPSPVAPVARAVLRIHASQLHPLLLLNATSPAAAVAAHSNMLVVFSQESPTLPTFTFIGHSEVVASRGTATARFLTTFNLSYHPGTHRSVLVHLYDGARAAALIEAGKGGSGSGLRSLADDLLASFVLDMDDLAEATKGSMLIYAPQQITEKHKLRCMNTNVGPDGVSSNEVTEPRIMVAFNITPQTTAVVSATAATAKPAPINAVDAQARLMDALSTGSICTLFHPVLQPGRRALVFDVDDASASYPVPLVDPEAKGMESVRLFIDTASARLYWCASKGERILSINHSIRVSNLIAVVVGRHTSSMLHSTHALNAPDNVCWSVIAKYDLPTPLQSGFDSSSISSVPITLDFASGSHRARSMWIHGLGLLVSQLDAGRRLPVVESTPDIDQLEKAHSEEFAQALAVRKKRQATAATARAESSGVPAANGRESPTFAAVAAASRAAHEAAAAAAIASAKAAAAAKAREDSQDEMDLSDISTDESDEDDFTKPKKSKRERKPKQARTPKAPLINRSTSLVNGTKPKQPSAMALAMQAKQHAPPATISAASAQSDAPTAGATADDGGAAAFAATLSSVSSTATVAPLTLGPLPSAAPLTPALVTLGSVSIPRSYFTPLYLATDIEITLRISCTNLFALDASRPPDLVLAVFQGSQDFDPNSKGDKPATPSQLSFSPAAAFKYTLVDNSEAVSGNTEPHFDKQFEFELEAGGGCAAQHLRINLYDAEGEGVTAKDQLGLVWFDLRTVIASALAQEPGGGSADAITFPSDHHLTVPLIHPTNPALHSKLQRMRSAMHLQLQILPKIRPQFIQRGMDDEDTVVPGTIGDVFTPSHDQMAAMNLAPLLSAIKARAKQSDAAVADYGNAVLFPTGTYAWIKVACNIAHTGELPLPTRQPLANTSTASSSSSSAMPPPRQLLFALYERAAPSTAPRASNPLTPFLFKSVSAPCSYITTAGGGGAARGTFVAEVHVGERSILLLAVFFADQLAAFQGSMPDPTRAWGCCLLSAEELAKSSRALKLPLYNPFVPALGKRLASAQAVCQVQLKEIIEKDEHGATKAAANAAAEQFEAQELDRINAAKDLMFEGSFMRRHELIPDAQTGSFAYKRTPLVLFGRLELEETEAEDAAVEEEAAGAWAVLWCDRAHDRPLRKGEGEVEEKIVVEGNYLQVAFIKHIYLGRACSDAFAHPQAMHRSSSSSLKSSGCFFRIVGHTFPDTDSDEYDIVDLSLEAESTEICDAWVLGLINTAKEDGNNVNVHYTGEE